MCYAKIQGESQKWVKNTGDPADPVRIGLPPQPASPCFLISARSAQRSLPHAQRDSVVQKRQGGGVVVGGDDALASCFAGTNAIQGWTLAQ